MKLPGSILSKHIAIVGMTGSGKTVTAKGIIEDLLGKGERVCIVDPVAAWWGLRSDTSGKPNGFPVVIFGGRHGDVQIGGSHGGPVADIVATSTTPTIIDLKQLSVKERTSFFTDFAVRLMQKNEGILHLVIDEAHLFAPKGKVNSNQAGEMLSETNNLVTGGRGVGLRIIMITQRPAKLHNDCLASADTLIAMRVALPADRDAVESWIREVGDPVQGKSLMQSLPRLETGEGWVWSPLSDVFKRTTFPMIKTFDSSNPRNLHLHSKVKLSSIDLAHVTKQLYDAAGDVVNNDPVQLKRLLAQAQAELKKRVPQVTVAADHVDSAALKREYDRGVAATKKAASMELARYEKESVAHAKRVAVAVERSTSALGEAILAIQRFKRPEMATLDIPAAEPEPPPRNFFLNESHTTHIPKREVKSTAPSNGDLDLSGPARKILTALAEMLALGVEDVPRQYAMFMSGYTNLTSTGFVKAMSQLSSSKLTSYPSAGSVALTEEGRAHAPDVDQPSTGAELRSRFMSLLGGKKSDMLRVLIAEYPRPVAREDLMRATGYGNLTSTGFVKAVSQLSSLGLLTYPSKGAVRAGDLLFLPHERK